MRNRQQLQSSRSFDLRSVVSLLVTITLLAGCASEKGVQANDGLTISHITVHTNGATSKSRPNMTNICKGFILSKQDVQQYFVYARHVKVPHSDKSYDILPCYASGTAEINNQAFHWIIHSGGIGEFFNKNSRFVKICGKDCCGKVAGMC